MVYFCLLCLCFSCCRLHHAKSDFCLESRPHQIFTEKEWMNTESDGFWWTSWCCCLVLVFVEILEANLPLLHLAGHVFPLKLRLLHCQEEDQRHVGFPRFWKRRVLRNRGDVEMDGSRDRRIPTSHTPKVGYMIVPWKGSRVVHPIHSDHLLVCSNWGFTKWKLSSFWVYLVCLQSVHIPRGQGAKQAIPAVAPQQLDDSRWTQQRLRCKISMSWFCFLHISFRIFQDV